MELRRTVGLQIRRYREEQHLTLQQLAGMIGTSYTHLWKVENARVSVGLDLLGRLSDALDVPLRDIVTPPDAGEVHTARNHQTYPMRVPLPSISIEYDGLAPHERG